MNDAAVEIQRTNAGQFVAWVRVWLTRATGERVPVHRATKPCETEDQARRAASALIDELLH